METTKVVVVNIDIPFWDVMRIVLKFYLALLIFVAMFTAFAFSLFIIFGALLTAVGVMHH